MMMVNAARDLLKGLRFTRQVGCIHLAGFLPHNWDIFILTDGRG